MTIELFVYGFILLVIGESLGWCGCEFKWIHRLNKVLDDIDICSDNTEFNKGILYVYGRIIEGLKK